MKLVDCTVCNSPTDTTMHSDSDYCAKCQAWHCKKCYWQCFYDKPALEKGYHDKQH